jgi:hypothetical protein
VVTGGVFVALGITMANDTGDPNQAGFGILGAVFTVIFYGVVRRLRFLVFLHRGRT